MSDQPVHNPRDRGIVAGLSVFAIAVFLFIHFRHPEIFQRALIDYDDRIYIKPIGALTLGDYFGTWMRNPENFAFPLRDMTFFIDFAIQRATGVATFWLTNALFYLAVMAVFYRMFRDSLAHLRGWPLALILFIAFHPALIEMVQWASNRKHLMVGLILSLASVRVLRLSRAQEYPSEKDWAFFFGAYIAAWLCWPSASLWIFAVLFIFRKKMKFDSRAGLRVLAALIMGVGAIAWTYFSHQTFVGGKEITNGSAGILRMPTFGIMAAGRAAYSFFLPYFPNFAGQQPYYRLEHIAGFIGLVMIIALLYFSVRKYRRLNIDARAPAADAFLISAALLIPPSLTVLTFVEFVWADRYLFLPAPYFVLGMALLAYPPETFQYKRGVKVTKPNSPGPILERHRVAVLVALAVFTLASAFIGARLVPLWSTGFALFSECSRTEHTPRCLVLAIEKSYDISGCRDLTPFFETARTLSARGSLPYDFSFRVQTPLYESICIAQSDLPPAAQDAALAAIYRTYESPQYAAFGEVLSLLRRGEFPLAFGRAYETYLGSQFGFADLFPKIGNLMRAQASALCELAKLNGLTKEAEDCGRRANILAQLTINATPFPAQYQWGFEQTLEAYNDGKRLKSANQGSEHVKKRR